MTNKPYCDSKNVDKLINIQQERKMDMLKNCEKCGAKFDELTEQCPNCSLAKNESKPKKTRTGKNILIITVSLFTVIATVVGLSYFNIINLPVLSSWFKSDENVVAYDDSKKINLPDKTEVANDDNVNKENLVADESDFTELTKLIEKTNGLWGSFEYSYDVSNAYQMVLSELFRPYGGISLYTYFYNKEPEYFYASNFIFEESPESERDPLQKFGKHYEYAQVSAEEIDWLIQNIFNVKPNRNDATIIKDGECDSYYYDGNYYYSCGDGGDCGNHPVIADYQKDSNNVYTVKFDLITNDDNHTYECSQTVVCTLKNIEGKKQWSFLSIEMIDSEK